MERFGEQTLSRGALLFAFNSPKQDYFKMAENAAKRLNYFLQLPVTLITNLQTIENTNTDCFDNVILVDSDESNKKSGEIWINKGRFQAYELSPYEETLLLDVDYVINSDSLSKVFYMYDDFACFKKVDFLMQKNHEKVRLNNYGLEILWATVIFFRKTDRVKQIFDCIKMVQNNYEHYASLHDFISGVYRNDYALTLAVRIVNGHCDLEKDIIPWSLMHIGEGTKLVKNSDDLSDTEYTVLFDRWSKNKVKKEYIVIKDFDFHVLNKANLMEIINV